jgi:hypothetical protein
MNCPHYPRCGHQAPCGGETKPMSCPHNGWRFDPARETYVCSECGLLQSELAAGPIPIDDRTERLRSGLDSLKADPGLAAIADCGERLAALVHHLATCDHSENTARWELSGFDHPTSLEWCAHCGARRAGDRPWIVPAAVKEAKSVDAVRQNLGASFGRPSYDSDVKNVIPIKPRT